jgi:cytochrome c peroxidase
LIVRGPAPALIALFMAQITFFGGDDAVIGLGRRLFFDQKLSRDGSLSCAGCHHPNRAFTDGRPVPFGVAGARGTRNVPTLVNRAAGQSFSWDGRAKTLEEQAIQPILEPKELGMTRASAEALIRSAPYRPQFRAIFQREPTLEDLGVVLAAYVRTIVSGESRYDRFEHGDKTALSRSEIQGLHLFRLKAHCSACHFGPNLTDEQFHNTGIASRSGAPADVGREGVTGDPKDRRAFKTPTLRDVARTAPYMHDGSFATLEQVLDYYDRGGEGRALDPHLHPLHLTAGEKQDIIAYLVSLNGVIRETSGPGHTGQ